MADHPSRVPWRSIWRTATSDTALLVLLLGLAASLVISIALPQIPLNTPAAYAQWRSHAQARFGDATSAMRALGLFTIKRSLAFRTLLALLAGCLLLRLTERMSQLYIDRKVSEPSDDWQEQADIHLSDVVEKLRRRRYRVLEGSSFFQIDRWPWGNLFPLLTHCGALLLLVGLLLTHLWGWQVEDIVLQVDDRTTLRGTGKWGALAGESSSDVTHSPGIITFVEERGPGVRVSAADDNGQPIPLQRAAGADPSTQLRIPLTEDQYFAIPGQEMIVRLRPRAQTPQSPIEVQFYRSPPGQLIEEMVTKKRGIARLTVENLTLQLTPDPYARVTAAFNPGRWPTGVGLAFLLIGLMGSAVWPARRFWLREREKDGALEWSGEPPATLAGAEGS